MYIKKETGRVLFPGKGQLGTWQGQHGQHPPTLAEWRNVLGGVNALGQKICCFHEEEHKNKALEDNILDVNIWDMW